MSRKVTIALDAMGGDRGPDSVVPAAGPEAEGSEAAVRLMGVLRSLGPGISRLLVGHVPKGEATQNGPTYPFGSVFYWNLSRSVWEIRSDDDDREHLRLSLTHKKVNAGPKLPTFGLDFHFQADRITVNFPWGSLLRAVAAPETTVLASIAALGRCDAAFTLLVNMATFDDAAYCAKLALPCPPVFACKDRTRAAYAEAGLEVMRIDANARTLPYRTTWGQRLTKGTQRQVLHLEARVETTK